MPTVSALLWKNLIFHPVPGILAAVWRPVRRRAGGLAMHHPLLSIILIVSWQWLPFAILIPTTASAVPDQSRRRLPRP